ncbi:PREDICTED: bone morphogenetic protein receptor type-2-like [Cyprinodon variegatus]|uniref:bone morphogenetic protein receptor type-2-like n=1 Tax=Cyprinodon variegatus TaxID=28743 RepID=UPI0007429B58|nr:PREDICTED: bone morphogenetic protein receptor type-2-like [Cyprinodon variegatus]
MEFYPHGCLSQYLSENTVDWLTCCRMAHGVTRGLAFLHTELCRGDQYKPPVAHRDLTSRNVLVRSDLSCVLADFGLSMKLTGTRSCRPGDDETVAISEVGTVRYMSPEVLGGALNLRDCESALKQVDVYALGLLLWESFRRCSDLFPGDTVPDYQLAFQEEVGNHPTFEDMQILVVREKHRPRFPEVWKENSLALRALKETMEDCWDHDAEARLTAQCAEERLADLILLSPQTALHNHRNLTHSCWTPQISSVSSYIEDLQVGVVKNLHGDGHARAEGGEKNSNCYNQQRQQTQARPPPSSYSISDLRGGAAAAVCLQLTEEDLDASKMDAQQVQKNLREPSQENLVEHSQKRFGSVPQTSYLNHSMEATRPEEPEPSSSIQQQNLPQRPTSLQLLPKPRETRVKAGRFRSNHRQVETGVAKMNAIIPSAEPHLVTTVTNLRSGATIGSEELGAAAGHNSGVPVLVTNRMRGGGRSNPAGPKEEEEEGGGREGGADSVDLTFSPDEHEPLLRREQLPAESDPPLPPHPPHPPGPPGPAGPGSNSNNNNNRATVGPELPEPEPLSGPTASGTKQKVLHSGPEPSIRPADGDEGPDQTEAEGGLQNQNSGSGASKSKVQTSEPSRVLQNQSSPPLDVSALEAKALDPDPAEPAEPQTAGLLAAPLRQTRTRRPERPCSLDLSSSCVSSDDASLMDLGSLSASGEKIKRRVKTPYTLKKWRPASWVVSSEHDLDLEFDFRDGGGPNRAGGAGVPRINQSKSSMAVFLVGGGTTATATSEPDGLTRF